jgi:ribosomal protein S27AE
VVRNTKAKRPRVRFKLKIFADLSVLRSHRTSVGRKGRYMRVQYASRRSKPPMLPPVNPCPVCGAETTLAEIEPHPLHANFEIHGYLCGRCGPIKSMVVLRGPPLQPVM